MKQHRFFGLMLAAFGTLVLTPDALLMRLSSMGGFQMVGWRGLLMGTVMIGVWALTSRGRARDLAFLATGPGLLVVVCQFFNATLFSLGISLAPVAVMLLAVATVPVFAALFAWLIIGEPTRRATWLTIVAVMAGIALAVLGDSGSVAFDRGSLWGAFAGLGTAMALALSFVMLRACPQLPIPLLIGLGGLLAGVTGLAVTGPGMMTQGEIWPIVLCGMVILPVSFFSLSLASRHTHASNVSLLLLLETVLGPLWVWLGLGETPTPLMLWGGVIVIGSLAVYLWHNGKKSSVARNSPA